MGQKSIAAVPLMAGREEKPGAGRGEEAAPPGRGQDGGTEEDPHHEARGGSIQNIFRFLFLCYNQLIFFF
jgi:hypothetical protein